MANIDLRTEVQIALITNISAKALAVISAGFLITNKPKTTCGIALLSLGLSVYSDKMTAYVLKREVEYLKKYKY